METNYILHYSFSPTQERPPIGWPFLLFAIPNQLLISYSSMATGFDSIPFYRINTDDWKKFPPKSCFVVKSYYNIIVKA